jgi:hypothetical protein
MQEHQVPTHLQAEDKVLLGLTFPQIVACAAVMGLAYGLWQHVSFLPDGVIRIALAALIGVIGLAAVVIRPGGRAGAGGGEGGGPGGGLGGPRGGGARGGWVD